MRRSYTVLLTLCLLLGLTACTPAAPAETGGLEKPGVTLTLMLPQTHYKDFLQSAISRFEAEYPGIRIDPQIIPDNQWIDLVKRKVAVGETPDLIRIDRGLIIDVGTEHFVQFGPEADWYGRVLPEQLESKLIGGRLYGLPIGATSSVGVAYNQSLFTRYGVKVPENMDELLEACRRFREVGVTPLYASDKDSWTVGLGFTASAPQAVPEQTWEDLKTGELHWTQVPEFKEILDTFAQLRAEGFTNDNYMEATYASAVTAMAGGNTAMYITGQFFINDVLDAAPDMELMMTPVPYRPGILTVIPGPGQLSLFRSSAHPEEAKIFLDWFSQPDNMDAFNAGWGHTAVFSDQALELPEWQQHLYDTYISEGKTVPEMDMILSGVDFNDFWAYQQEMIAGLLTSDEVLELWDQSFSAQMRDKQIPGWK